MSSRPRRGGAEKPKKESKEDVVEMIKGITGANSEDVEAVLKDCGGNADEATTKLLENPDLIFSQVQSKKDKKKKREEERKTQPAPQSIEPQRGGFSGRGRGRGRERGERSGRGYDRSQDRSTDRGLRSQGHSHTGPPPGFPAQPQGQSQVEVQFDGVSEPTGWDGQANEPQSGGWAAIASGELPKESAKQESAPASAWGASSTPQEPALGSWDTVLGESDRPSKEQSLGVQDAGTSAPAPNTAQQPIGKQSTNPSPIGPPQTPAKSMADLFKPKSEPIASPAQEQATSHTGNVPTSLAPGTPQGSLTNGLGHESVNTNGWGPNTSDQRIEIQGDSLGTGFLGGQKQVQPSLGAIQASSGLSSMPLPPLNQSSHGQQHASPSQNWTHKDEQPASDSWVGSQTSTGLGNLNIDSSLHHSYLGDPQTLNQGSWMSKPASSQPQSLGSAVLSSLNQPAMSHQISESLPTVSPRGSDFNANNSAYSGLGQPLSQRMPSNQSQQQGNTMQFQFGDIGGQLGQLDISDTNSNSTPSAHFSTAFGQNALNTDLRSSNRPSLEQNRSSFNQPSTSAPISSYAHHQGQQSVGGTNQQNLNEQAGSQIGGLQGLSHHSLQNQGTSQHSLGAQGLGLQSSTQGGPAQASQHQRAVNAFNSAAPQSQVPPAQKPTTSIAQDSLVSGSQNVYGNQGYQGQGYSQYPYSSNQNYQAYSQQQQQQEPEQAQAPNTPQAPAVPAKRGTGTSTNSSAISYDPANLASLNQQAGQRDYTQSSDYQPAAQKYASNAQGSSAATHGSSTHAANALSQQQALSQMSTYGNQLGGMGQNFYNNQQYSFPQYAGYSQGTSGNYGYGQAYQQPGYSHPTAGYAQSGKYGTGYGATGGYQHASYGMKEKEHQAQHLGHGLYNQQQLPLGNRQHYASAGLQDPTGYGYQNASPGYGGYGRQYQQQFYGQNQ